MRLVRLLMISAGILKCLIATTAMAEGPRVTSKVPVSPEREAYFGDLHLHTRYSLSVALRAPHALGPDDAYRFAKGETVSYRGAPARRRAPLDFVALTESSGNLGMFNELDDTNSPISQTEAGKK